MANKLFTGSNYAVNSYQQDIHAEIFRIVLVGGYQVGKSWLLYTFSNREDSKNPGVSTIGVEYQHINVLLGDSLVHLLIWDTSGQEQFQDYVVCYYRSASGFILVFDVTNEDSFLSLHKTFKLIKDHCYNEFAETILVGTKCDLEEEREVSEERAQIVADELGLRYLEVSSVSRQNVDLVFNITAHNVIETNERIFKRRNFFLIKAE